MPDYLVEVYQPRLSESDVAAISARARGAAEELTREGIPVGYLRSIFVPGDESCFHLFEASSLEAVAEASRRARIEPERIVEALQ
ncbi:MAG: nickel-binding protein [Gaiellaceae bacterium]